MRRRRVCTCVIYYLCIVMTCTSTPQRTRGKSSEEEERRRGSFTVWRAEKNSKKKKKRNKPPGSRWGTASRRWPHERVWCISSRRRSYIYIYYKPLGGVCTRLSYTCVGNCPCPRNARAYVNSNNNSNDTMYTAKPRRRWALWMFNRLVPLRSRGV